MDAHPSEFGRAVVQRQQAGGTAKGGRAQQPTPRPPEAVVRVVASEVLGRRGDAQCGLAAGQQHVGQPDAIRQARSPLLPEPARDADEAVVGVAGGAVQQRGDQRGRHRARAVVLAVREARLALPSPCSRCRSKSRFARTAARSVGASAGRQWASRGASGRRRRRRRRRCAQCRPPPGRCNPFGQVGGDCRLGREIRARAPPPAPAQGDQPSGGSACGSRQRRCRGPRGARIGPATRQARATADRRTVAPGQSPAPRRGSCTAKPVSGLES